MPGTGFFYKLPSFFGGPAGAGLLPGLRTREPCPPIPKAFFSAGKKAEIDEELMP
jgi:hypothetical protein